MRLGAGCATSAPKRAADRESTSQVSRCVTFGCVWPAAWAPAKRRSLGKCPRRMSVILDVTALTWPGPAAGPGTVPETGSAKIVRRAGPAVSADECAFCSRAHPPGRSVPPAGTAGRVQLLRKDGVRLRNLADTDARMRVLDELH